MPEDYALLPETAAESQAAVLAFVGIVGGGLVAYQAGRAIEDGDLFKTDALVPEDTEKAHKAGALATIAGLTFLGLAAKSAYEAVGWKPLVYGSLAITGAAAIGRALRR